MDSLNNFLPEELVRHVQQYTSHPICDTPYFKHLSNMRIHNNVTHELPQSMLEMFVCYFNQEFMFVAKDCHIRSNLISILKKQERWSNNWRGNDKVQYYVFKVFDKLDHDMCLKKNGKIDFHIAWMNVYTWLTKLVEQEYEYSRKSHLKKSDIHRSSWKHHPHTPDKYYSKTKLQELLTDNNIPWYKSWNKKKLIKAWYSQD